MRLVVPGLVLVVVGVAVACSSPQSSGTGGAGTSSSVAGTGGSSVAGVGGGTGAGGADPTVAECATCLDAECAAEKAACGADCYAIQACLDSVCFNLSATGASDEGACQVYCQSLSPNGKAAHLAYVNCANGQPEALPGVPTCGTPGDAGGCTCQPPCAAYSYDYDQCVAAQNAGACQSARAVCLASSDCTAYQTCASGCTTLAACQACAATAGGAAGEKLYQAYQLCLDTTCLAQGWLPHF